MAGPAGDPGEPSARLPWWRNWKVMLPLWCAIGYLVSYVAIRRGYSKDVLTYRGLTIAVIIGIVIGFVLGKLL